MAPQYKLSYFDIRGLGEPIRFIFHYGKIDFEDNRISFNDWPAYKETLPGLGFLPFLEVDGKRLTQSSAICQFLAEDLNLGGKDKWENLQINMAFDSFNDWRIEAISVFKEKIPEAKAIKKERAAELTPKFLKELNKQIEENNGYLANKKLSWVDLYAVALIPTILFVLEDPNLLKQYSHVQGLIDKIENLPGIKEWIAKRPKTDL